MTVSEAKDCYEWIVCMVADGWEPKPDGSGQFVYLEKDGKYYKGPVTTGRWAWVYVTSHHFLEDVEREKIRRAPA